MRIHFHGGHLNLLIKHILTYMIIAGFALVVGSVSFYEAKSMLEEEAVQFYRKSLSEISKLVDERIDNAVTMMEYISNQYGIRWFLNAEDPLRDNKMYSLRQCIDSLGEIQHMNPMIAEIAVYSKANQYVITGLYGTLLENYIELKQKSSGTTAHFWDTEFTEYSSITIGGSDVTLVSNDIREVVPVMQLLPVGSKNVQSGLIVIWLDHEQLFSGFVDDGLFESCFVLNSKENPVITFGDNPRKILPLNNPPEDKEYYYQEINGTNYVIIRCKSKYNMTFVAAAQNNSVVGHVQYLHKFFTITLILDICFCLILAAIFTWNNIKPFRSIASLLFPEPSKNLEGPAELYNSITDLVQDNREMQVTIKQQSEEMKNIFYLKLLLGSFDTEEEAIAFAHYINCDSMTHMKLAVFLFHISFSAEQERNISEIISLKRRLRDAISNKPSFIANVEIGPEEIALLGDYTSETNPEKIIHEINDIISSLNLYPSRNTNFVFVGVGKPRERLSEIYHSYQEALIALKWQTGNSAYKVLEYGQSLEMNSMFRYSVETEKMIINALRCGNEKSAQEILKSVFANNQIDHSTPRMVIDLLLGEIEATFLKAILEIMSKEKEQMNQMISNLLNNGRLITTTESISSLFSMIEDICDYVNQHKGSHNDYLKKEILSYLESNFRNANLSRGSVAEHFNVSESYLSTFIHEQTGKNYVSLVERLRLECACNELLDTEKTIDQVASSVGYTSTHSFRRAFKRYYGYTPVQYKTDRAKQEDLLPHEDGI